MSQLDGQRLVVGTRGSELALVQARMVEARLRAAHPGCEVVREVIRTTGDRRTDVPLSEVAKVTGVFDKGVFIKELEVALEDCSIDLAVHSLKDLPSELESRFRLGAVLERAPVRDVLVTRTARSLGELPAGARVATGSVRRAWQLRFLRPDLEIIDIRGNVPTRLGRLLEPGGPDAVMLAEAGLVRLGHDVAGGWASVGEERLPVVVLEEDEFFPAAGQGAIAVEVRADDAATHARVAVLDHAETHARVSAEREFLRLLGAGCHTPVGVVSVVDGARLRLRARLFDESDPAAVPREAAAEGPADAPLLVGAQLYQAFQ